MTKKNKDIWGHKRHIKIKDTQGQGTKEKRNEERRDKTQSKN